MNVDEQTKELVHHHLIQETDFLKKKDSMNEDELRAYVDRAITQVCQRHHIHLSVETRIALLRELVSAVVSLGPLREFMEDDTVTEIMVNGPDKVYVQRKGKIFKTRVRFESMQHLMHTVQKLLLASGTNRRVDESNPYADFSLPDGSRVNVILPPCSLIGPVITIRKFLQSIETVDHLVDLGMLNKPMAMLLTTAMQAKLNVVFCGATGTGKTTTLNVMSRHIPEDERIVTIEDTPELRLRQEHVVPLITKPANIEGKGEITIRHLFINSLRMRPDRVILGEVRSGEMLDLIQSISSGHTGSLAIVHADSPQDCFNRMITMMLMTGIPLRVEEIQKQVCRAIDLIVHIELFPDGVRRITHITEPVFDDRDNQVHLFDLFVFEQEGLDADGRIKGDWKQNPYQPRFLWKYRKRYVSLPEGFFNNQPGS